MLSSLSVYLTCQKKIWFKTYPPESLHGLLFKIFADVDPELAQELHDQDSKEFSLSTFQPYPDRQGAATYIKPGVEYKFRITFLKEHLSRRFIQYFLQNPDSLQLNGQEIQITRILSTDFRDPWCRESDFMTLLDGKSLKKVKLTFLSATSFRSGEQNLIFPIPRSVFGSLLYRWQAATGPELDVRMEDFDQIQVSRYQLKTRMERFRNYSVKGFVGDCYFDLSRLAPKLREQVVALARFGFFAGVGYKPTMGLGQIAWIG